MTRGDEVLNVFQLLLDESPFTMKRPEIQYLLDQVRTAAEPERLLTDYGRSILETIRREEMAQAA